MRHAYIIHGYTDEDNIVSLESCKFTSIARPRHRYKYYVTLHTFWHNHEKKNIKLNA